MLSTLLLAATFLAPSAQADAVVRVSTPSVTVRIGAPAPAPRVVVAPPPRVVVAPPPPQQVCHVIDRGPPGPRGPDTVHCTTVRRAPVAPARPPARKVVVRR